ncbi:MAG: TIGR00266 family protein [Planctomycetaceae bacterium]|nr:TIGR00266 family protein [Planctomycetaceae bacterium]
MKYKILSRPSASVAKIALDEEESITCEVGAMIAMTPGFEVETTTKKKGGSGGGLGKALKRMLAGESMFLNHFTAADSGQVLIIGPRLLGDIVHFPLRGGSLIVQGASWLASDTDIEIDATWQGLGKALFSGESMFWLQCTGTGSLFLSSFGAIYEVEVDGEHIVDTGHIVAFEDTLQFQVTKAGSSLIGSFLGGEGLVCRFSGQGRLFCQSHNPPSFGKVLGPKLKPR